MKYLIICFYIVLPSVFYSQSTGLNNALKLMLEERNPGGQIYTILVQGDIEKIKSEQQTYNYLVNYYEGDIASITCNIKSLPRLIAEKVISYAEIPEPRKRALNDTMLYKNRIKQVKLWTSPLPRGYDGEGIVMGILDSGIDFSHPDFKDSTGKSRIQFIWDQSKTSGSTVPSPFNYGIEWTKAQIDAGQCTHTDFTYFGHGTHVSGIAASNGKANGRHEGCAPKVELVVVAIDFNSSKPTIADGVKYVLSKAAAMGKPCVINASVGDYYGSHDATDLEAKLIENQIKNKPGVVLIAAAGNAGNVKFHTKTNCQNGDTLFTWLKRNNNAYTYWCYGDVTQVSNLKFSVGANRNNNSDVGRIAFKNYNYGFSGVQNDTLIKNGKRYGIIKTLASVNNYGVYELYIQIAADSLNLKWRIETTGQGLHHAWNFDFVSNGLPTPVQFPKITKYVKPDTMCSMVSGFQNSEEVITVANYVNLNRYYNVSNTLQITPEIPGGIANTSSKGPTRDGRLKPDISATGHNIFSAMALGLQSQYLQFNPNSVAQGSMHVIGGGTSASSPVVAGLAALYLQRYPKATNRDVKNSIRNCAFQDAFTGNSVPNYEWGYGKLDGKAAMTCVPQVYVSLPEKKWQCSEVIPNPFFEKAKLQFDTDINGTINFYSINGQLLFSDEVTGTAYELNASALPANTTGLILARVVTLSAVYNIKLIKQNN